eukprot:6179315-Pleurochrysis_carterae.AAC.1
MHVSATVAHACAWALSLTRVNACAVAARAAADVAARTEASAAAEGGRALAANVSKSIEP